MTRPQFDKARTFLSRFTVLVKPLEIMNLKFNPAHFILEIRDRIDSL